MKKLSSKRKNISKKKNFLKLPFEIYFSGPIDVREYQFKSDVDKLKKFSDIKALLIEEGRAYGVTLLCESNSGEELYTCFSDNHDEVLPEWLKVVDIEDIDMNNGMVHSVKVADKTIVFKYESVEEYAYMELCNTDEKRFYRVDGETPDYIVLDAFDSRVKINLDGFELDEDGEPDESKQLINFDELDPNNFQGCQGGFESEEISKWITRILKKHFPKEINLRYSKN